MATNFRFNNGGTITDFSDVFIRRDIFLTGGLWTWGSAGAGQLGDNTRTAKSSPVQTVASGSNWKQISGNGYYSGNMAGIKTDGTLWIWGTYAALGDNGVYGGVSSPIQTVAGGSNWKQVSTANDVTGAIKTDGTLWMWGRNYEGAMGDGTNSGAFSPQLSPVQTIAGGAYWKQVSANTTVGAIKTDGTLWMWGDNTVGNLGDNTRTLRSSPVQTVSGGTNWKQVSSGGNNVGAIKTDGTLWMWGTNSSGQLGDNTRTNTSSPIQTVAGGSNWKQVCAGGSTTAAIKTDGTLWLWGSNTGFGPGQLGDGTILAKSSPVQTVAGGTNWKQVSGNYAMAAIKTDGTLWTWGDNSNGQLGDGTITAKSSPIQTLAGGTNWKQVTMNGYAGAISEVFSGGYGPVTTLVEIYASGTWTVPSGVTSLDLVIVGAGGNGGSVTKTTAWEYSAGGGGGAGQYLRYTTYAVSPGQVLTVTIGVADGGAASGQGGTTTVTGGSGGTVSAVGGLKGTNGTNSTPGTGGDSGNGFAGAPPDSIDTGGGGGGATAAGNGSSGGGGAGVTPIVGGTSFYLADGGSGLGVFSGNTTIGGGGNGASRLAVGTSAGQVGVSGAVIFAYVT